jgi:aminoglycoside phosphotransferase (APT) family kinase protein
MSEAEAPVEIPLKGARRDPEQARRALASWLAPRIGATGRVGVSPVTSPGGTGVANETLLFDASWSAAGRGHTEGFVARVASERPLYLDADIEVHAKVYEALADVDGVPVPRVYGYEPDESVLGAPFFVMERIEGEVPGDQPHWQTAGFVHDASPERRRAMWDEAVRVLATLHQVDTTKFPFLAAERPTSGLADHLAWWRRYLDDGSAGSPVDTLEEGHAWLLAHIPEPAPTGFSWGDSRFANIMFRRDRVVAIFDWDTASLAGAEADLAWWRFMDGPAAAELPGIGDGDELVQRWEELTGRQVRDLEWYDVFTSYRLGVVMLNLFRNMAADGLMPADVADQQGRDSGPSQALAAQLARLR